MKACWSQGDLRALLDGELPREQAAVAERHLEECAECKAAYRELGERATLVASLMGALSEDVAMPAPERRRTFGRPAMWVVTAAALAATLAFAMVLSRHPAEQQVRAGVQTPPAPPAVEMQASPPPAAAASVAAEATESAAPERVHRLPSRPQRATPVQYYMALDEEPIDTGLVMRVALPSGAQADVIVDGDGRARAIRPVSTVLKEER